MTLVQRRSSHRPGVEGAGVVLSAVLLVAPMWSGVPVVRFGAVAGLVALVVVASAAGTCAVVRAAVPMVVASVVFTLGADVPTAVGAAVTTVAVGVLPVLALHLVGRRLGWASTTPWLRVGRVRGLDVVLAVVTVGGAGLALTVWALWADPQNGAYFQGAGDLPLGAMIAAVVGFALVNPVWEEALFRGVLQQELGATWGVPAAVVAQAVLFGSAHWAGFPSGWTGMAMAGGWGLLLGVLRARTGGVAVPYVVHVAANATIGALAIAVVS